MNFQDECIQTAAKLFEILEVGLDEVTEQERELILAFAYGIQLEAANERKIANDEFSEGMAATIEKVFGLSPDQAKEKEKELESSLKEEKDSAKGIMIYQGKETYTSYKNGDESAVYDRLTLMIDNIVMKVYDDNLL